MGVSSGQFAVEAASLVGSSLADRYRLLEVIGEGGMGRVFLAEEIATGRPVAVKLLHPEFADVDQVVQRFEREGKVTTQLSHPHIVKVIEFDEWRGRLFLAMELIPGKSLKDLIERGGDKIGRRLTVEAALAIMRPVLDALEYAHGRGVVHRDLKPENIMVTPGRGRSPESVKLLDFGIAKLGDRSERRSKKLTQQGLVLGTPGYMSPEQAVGQEADVRSDLYSFGVILYQMLTGRRPFEADSDLDVLVMHLNMPPRPLRDVAPDAAIPPGLDELILRLLAKQPAARFQSARELRQALARVAPAGRGAGVSGMEATILATTRRPASAGSRLLSFAVIAAAVAMLLGHHLRTGAAATPSSVVAGARAPTPARERIRRPPETVRATAPPAKHNLKQAKTASKSASKKKPAPPKRRH
jgi:serine/threonine protein kinase